MQVSEFMERYKKASSDYIKELDRNKMENLKDTQYKMDENIVKEFEHINTLLLNEKFLDNILDKMTIDEICEFEELIENDKKKIAKILSENPQIVKLQNKVGKIRVNL